MRSLAAAILAVALLAGPALARTRSAAPASAPPPAKPAQVGRWQLIEGTDQVAGGIGLRWLKADGDADAAVGMLACRSPSGLYVSQGGVTAKPGIPAIDLLVSGQAFAIPVASPPPDGKTVEAIGATPAGLLDALDTARTIQLVYGDQTQGLFAAPDIRVMKGFLRICRQISGDQAPPTVDQPTANPPVPGGDVLTH